MTTSRSGICKFIRRYKETGSIGRRPGSGRPSKITEEIKQIVEEQMRKDDETSAFQLHALLLSRGHYLSIRTILRCRTTRLDVSWNSQLPADLRAKQAQTIGMGTEIPQRGRAWIHGRCVV